MAFTAMAAAGSLLGGLSSVYGAATKDNTQQRVQNEIARQTLQESENNAAYQKALSTLAINQSRSGYTDSSGNAMRFDPTTNQWVSTLGKLPQAAQDASYNASIARNTTDLRNAQEVNALAMRRAAGAAPLAESAKMQYQGYTPMSGSMLGDLLRQQVITGVNQTNQPIIDSTLREFARTGADAGPVLAQLQRQNAENVRNSIIQSTIQGMTGAGQINQQRQGQMLGNYQSLSGMANPTLQYSQLSDQDPNKLLASLAADRAKAAGTVPLSAMYGLNSAQQGVQSASDKAISTTPVSSNNFLSGQLNDAASGLNKIFDTNGPLNKFTDAMGWTSTKQPISPMPTTAPTSFGSSSGGGKNIFGY